MHVACKESLFCSPSAHGVHAVPSIRALPGRDEEI